MNSSKKIMKNQGVDNKKKLLKGSSSIDRTKLKIFCGALVVVLVCSMVGYDLLRPRLIATVDNNKIYLSDMMYDIYTTESSASSMDSLYKQYYGKSYWDIEVDDNGTTGKEQAKTEVYDNAVQREILYLEAIKKGYTLTDDEKNAVQTTVTETLNNMKFKQKSKNGLKASQITSALEKQKIAERYKQDMINGFNIDDNAIKAGVSATDNRQYDIQYYYASFKSTDSTGKETTLTDDQKNNLKNEITNLLQTSKTASDFTKLIPDGSTTTIKYESKGLVESDKEFLNDDAKSKVKALANGAISDVIEVANDGYYFFKMVNNNSTEAYDSAVKEAIQTEENKQFDSAYKTLKESYSVKCNDKEWDKIVMGKVTL